MSALTIIVLTVCLLVAANLIIFLALLLLALRPDPAERRRLKRGFDAHQ